MSCAHCWIGLNGSARDLPMRTRTCRARPLRALPGAGVRAPDTPAYEDRHRNRGKLASESCLRVYTIRARCASSNRHHYFTKDN
jgi:hypothetical protein